MRVSLCLNGSTTADAEGRTPSLMPATKSDLEVPALWSASTVKEVGTAAA